MHLTRLKLQIFLYSMATSWICCASSLVGVNIRAVGPEYALPLEIHLYSLTLLCGKINTGDIDSKTKFNVYLDRICHEDSENPS